ncbi:hypothetical protein BEWA_009780 [Theileria equi strain WA]|uniref:Uncharacterized protein n=1 Tax=Theileria equi strain WA TaxID=1537102 RepID=L0B370_THEEQ|nr:hypothetical protein BEWA_009780 [Theileria equi strain WA]AFZ81564.1 hypothetical protein BEWA_009780 [Theileria equi strain WA]|eukprot:XP_004831230.1 hypothetical protein BEWA_009780 [Theileria equi strain WA]
MIATKITVGFKPPTHYNLGSNNIVGCVRHKSKEYEALSYKPSDKHSSKFKIRVGRSPPKPEENMSHNAESTTMLMKKNAIVINEYNNNPKSVVSRSTCLPEREKDNSTVNNCVNENIPNDTSIFAVCKSIDAAINTGVETVHKSPKVVSTSENPKQNNQTLPKKESKSVAMAFNSVSNLNEIPQDKKELLEILKSKIKITKNLLRIKNSTQDFIPKLMEMNDSYACVEYSLDRLKTNSLIIHADDQNLNSISSTEEWKKHIPSCEIIDKVGYKANSRLIEIVCFVE